MIGISGRMKRAVAAATFISINLACLWVYYHHSRQRGGPAAPPLLAYGASAAGLVNLIRARDRTASEGRWRLILYFGDSTHRSAIPNLKYAQILFNRFHSRGLDVIGIIAGTFPESEELAKRQLISYPLIGDADLSIARSLGLPPGVDGCFFADPEDAVQFSTTNLFDPEDLRQLTEKFLLGEVSYPASSAEVSLQEGESMPELTLLRVDDLALERLDQSKSQQQMFIIFTATCPACRLSGYLSDYARMKDRLARRAWVIFSQNFSQHEILFEAETRGIDTSNFYLAMEALPGIEDSYYWPALAGSEVLVIETDQAGKIKRIESWEELTARLEGGKSQ